MPRLWKRIRINSFSIELESTPLVLGHKYPPRHWENRICQECCEKRVKEIKRIKGEK